MTKRHITSQELAALLGEKYQRAAGSPSDKRVIPPDLLQRIADGQLTEDEVVLELERLGWRQVKHLFVAK